MEVGLALTENTSFHLICKYRKKNQIHEWKKRSETLMRTNECLVDRFVSQLIALLLQHPPTRARWPLFQSSFSVNQTCGPPAHGTQHLAPATVL